MGNPKKKKAVGALRRVKNSWPGSDLWLLIHVLIKVGSECRPRGRTRLALAVTRARLRAASGADSVTALH
jgi:hypothetical protein